MLKYYHGLNSLVYIKSHYCVAECSKPILKLRMNAHFDSYKYFTNYLDTYDNKQQINSIDYDKYIAFTIAAMVNVPYSYNPVQNFEKYARVER